MSGFLQVGLAPAWGRLRGYPAPATTGGQGDGIATLSRDASSGRLGPVVHVQAAGPVSFMAASPAQDRLYALLDPGDGTPSRVAALRMAADGALTPLNDAPTGSVEACHLALHPAGPFLSVAHFAGGCISTHPVGPDGGVSPPVQLVQRTGRGPLPNQAAAHPHMVLPGVDRRTVVVPDLGTDEVAVYRVDPDTGHLSAQAATAMPPGSGPRHAVFADAGTLFVVNELSASVTALSRAADGTMAAAGPPVSTVFDGARPGEAKPAAIRIAPGRRHLYVNNRGRETICVFRVDGTRLAAVQEIACHGIGARDMIVAGGFVYVANTRSSNVSVFSIGGDGRLTGPVQVLELPVPTCLVAAGA